MEQFNSEAISIAQPVSADSAEDRAQFIQKTYAHLALAIFLFIIIEAVFLNTAWIVNLGLSLIGGWSWLLMLGGFAVATSFAENWATKATTPPAQYGAMLLFVVAEAFLFVPLIYMAINLTGDFALIKQAGLLTVFLFTGISAVALISGKDFSGIRPFLILGSVLAIGSIVAGIAFGFTMGLWFSVAMILLAAGSILYQTSQMVHKYNTKQYVAASLGLFGSFMLLFWYILDIAMRFSGD